MQLQGLMMMLFFTIVIPIIIMSANHNVFFILVALVLFIVCLKDIKNMISFFKNYKENVRNISEEDIQDEKEVVEELEDMTNINMAKFSSGIGFAKSLTIILFFVYCSFFMDGLLIKSLISAIILYRIYLIIDLFSSMESKAGQQPHVISYYARTLYNLLSVCIIILAVYLKYLNSI